jgi:hypothetical protein
MRIVKGISHALNVMARNLFQVVSVSERNYIAIASRSDALFVLQIWWAAGAQDCVEFIGKKYVLLIRSD